jgi:protein-S-isoprenylcysteine O-methyltransferase Ste14
VNSETLFYGGVAVIIVFFVGVVIKKFKDDNKIDLNRHKWIIITYIVLLVIAIYVWKILVSMINTNMKEITSHNQQVEKFENGQE